MPGLLVKVAVCCITLIFCKAVVAEEPEKNADYVSASKGTRQFEFGPEADPVNVKVLVEEANLGSVGAEIIEIDFPPGYESRSHFHELEILYVVDGELEHIVDGESSLLKPGMIGIVRYPNEVIHKAHEEFGAKVLVVWPLGNELKGFDGLTSKPIE